jgi:hypothetical protein
MKMSHVEGGSLEKWTVDLKDYFGSNEEALEKLFGIVKSFHKVINKYNK